MGEVFIFLIALISTFSVLSPWPAFHRHRPPPGLWTQSLFLSRSSPIICFLSPQIIFYFLYLYGQKVRKKLVRSLWINDQ